MQGVLQSAIQACLQVINIINKLDIIQDITL